MDWQTIPNVNITTDKKLQVTIYIRLLFEYFKIMASSPGWLTINNTEKSVTVNIDKTTNDANIIVKSDFKHLDSNVSEWRRARR